MRHIILAIAIGFCIAFLGLLLTLVGFNLNHPVARYILLALFTLSLFVSLISGFWYQIPIKRIQQTKTPDKWIHAEIQKIDSDQYMMFHGNEFLNCDYVDLTVQLKSELPFDVQFRFLKGDVLINGEKKHTTLEWKSDVKLSKFNTTIIEKWRLNNWTDSLQDIYPNISRTMRLEISGEDNKHREYNKIITKEFNVGDSK